MPVDALQLQIVSALQRCHGLQRRSADGSHDGPPKLLTRAVKELEASLEELQAAHEQLLESRRHAEQLQVQLQQQFEKYWELFDAMPQAYVVTTRESVILEANRAAAELFNVSQRFLVGKPISVFISEDRNRILNEVGSLGINEQRAEYRFKLRPREKATIPVVARVSGRNDTVRWLINPQGDGSVAG